MSRKALAKLFDLESQESGASPLFMSPTLTKNPQSISGDNGGGDGGGIPVDEWLPITESRKGNVYTVTFHLVCSGIGFQVILLPAAFSALGWKWGMIILTGAFIWHLYTMWLLVHLHEAVPGTRFSRYLRLAVASFGVKKGKILALFPVMYLSGGAASLLVMTGGKAIQQLVRILSEDGTEPLTSVQCFVVFSCIAMVFSQFPNLNSLFGLSFIGSVMGVAYCTVIWILPVTTYSIRNRNTVSYATTERTFDNIFYAIGLVALAFRGNNIVLEIQGTLPCNSKNHSYKTMMKAIVISHVLIALCMFPLTIVVYWAYGDKIPAAGGPIASYLQLYGQDYSKRAMCFTHVTFIISCLCSYPIYLMPACDNLELAYTSKKQQPCSVLIRMMLRLFLALVCFFVGVTFPFLPYLAVLVGAIAMPATTTYPCFMWIAIKKPQKNSPMWLLNVIVGCLGISLSILLFIASALTLAEKGFHANFYKP